MKQYFLHRLISLIPTLLGITILLFFIINLAPGGPIEQKIHQMRFSTGAMDQSSIDTSSNSAGVTNEVIEALKKQYGFDKPIHIRYLIWLKNLATLDFGKSFTYEEPVLDLITSKFPVSLQFGIVSFLFSYLISIPLGVAKAVSSGTPFDRVSGFLLLVMYSIPSFMLAILLIVLFGGGSFLDLFPIGELYSDQYHSLSWWEKILDRIHHFVLPLVCYMIGSFTTLTLLMKNSLMEQIHKDYIRTARAKGLGRKAVYLKHALRNALIPIVTGLGDFLVVFFAGSFILEQIFQLDGIGLLGYNSILSRDYNVLMGLMFFQSLLFLLGKILSDLCYVFVDPRIDFR